MPAFFKSFQLLFVRFDFPFVLKELIKQGKKCDYTDVAGLEHSQGAIQVGAGVLLVRSKR